MLTQVIENSLNEPPSHPATSWLVGLTQFYTLARSSELGSTVNLGVSMATPFIAGNDGPSSITLMKEGVSMATPGHQGGTAHKELHRNWD